MTPPAHPYLHASSAFSATLQLYLRSAQLDTADLRYRRLGDTAFCCRLGCAATENAHHIFVQYSVLPFVRFGGLICRLWNRRRATFYRQSRLMWGRPFAPLLAAFSVMMRISGRRFTPCTTLEFSRHLLRFVALAICVCLRRFSSASRKHGILIPFDSLLMFGQSLNVTYVVGHFTCLLTYLI